jgi:hypothetical protein
MGKKYMINKLEIFQKELDYIWNPKIKEFAEKSLVYAPDYFFVIPASSGGKYHSTFASGEGGLVRHVRAAVRIAVELYRMDMFNYFTSDEKDLIIVALLLHDLCKSGIPKQSFTVPDHPLVAAKYINDNPDLHGIITEEQLLIVLDAIRSHSGQWNKDRSGNVILPKPKTKLQNFVHLIDMLASRKFLEMNFDIEVER